MTAKPYRPTPEPAPSVHAGMPVTQLFVKLFRTEILAAIREGRFSPKVTAQRAADKAVAEVRERAIGGVK